MVKIENCCFRACSSNNVNFLLFIASVTNKIEQFSCCFVNHWLNLEDIMLSEMSQTQKQWYLMSLISESNIVKTVETECRMVVAGNRDEGESGRSWSKCAVSLMQNEKVLVAYCTT